MLLSLYTNIKLILRILEQLIAIMCLSQLLVATIHSRKMGRNYLKKPVIKKLIFSHYLHITQSVHFIFNRNVYMKYCLR